jgi:hypothetical protein
LYLVTAGGWSANDDAERCAAPKVNAPLFGRLGSGTGGEATVPLEQPARITLQKTKRQIRMSSKAFHPKRVLILALDHPDA